MIFNKKTIAAIAVFCLSLNPIQLVSAASLDPKNPNDLGAAVGTIMENLISLYDPSLNSDGGWPEDQYSWFASGMAWGTVFSDHAITGNAGNDALAGESISKATYGTTGDLLGGSLRAIQEKLYGKWNDDIIWWAISMLEAVDIYGPEQTIPGGKKFLEVAELTWEQVYEQYDTEYCGGGIYWSRDRSSSNLNQVTYKSVITNAEFLVLSARLYSYTSDSKYLDAFDKTYKWLKDIQFITSDFTIIDGGNAPTCTAETRVDTTNWTYNYALTFSGLSYMYNLTQDASYLSDAKSIFQKSVTLFASNGIIQEVCESDDSCGRDIASHKMQYYKSLRHYYSVADSEDRATIESILDSTIERAVGNCNSDWWCNWKTNQVYSNYNDKDAYGQMAIAELLLSAGYVYGADNNVDGGISGAVQNSSKSNSANVRSASLGPNLHTFITVSTIIFATAILSYFQKVW